ncbi:hypothetical protein [Dyella sp.]|uniref:hypothetical protein n=1 Tax=Dyella sp. TaxID=1869338 RepID=UPI002D793D71|nr:hypothetical protein [Dyella sp.]HET6432354.1 hypothetical protein [Dyella sp.]
MALRLPRRQRNDVAFELRALLHEELQARAADAGLAADADMATAFLREFGRPEEVAARYRPALTIIDPADGQRFVRATVMGLVILWALGLVDALHQPLGSVSDVLQMLGHWWVGSVLPSLWWPGVLVIAFGLAQWSRRRWPQRAPWKPRDSGRVAGGRTSMVLAMVGIVCGLFVLIEPRWLLDVTLHGHAAAAAYDALTYTDTFRHRQAPWLLLALLLNLPLFAAVIIQGHWTPRLRQLELALGVLTCALMLWTALDGPVFIGEASSSTVKFVLVLLVVMSLGIYGKKLYRRVRPGPSPQAATWRGKSA